MNGIIRTPRLGRDSSPLGERGLASQLGSTPSAATGTGPGPIEKYRREIPHAVAEITQVVVDNPGQFALMFAGMVVLAGAARNIVKPRTALEAVALAAVLQVGLPMLAGEAVKRGWLKLRVRDADGCLVPLETGHDD